MEKLHGKSDYPFNYYHEPDKAMRKAHERTILEEAGYAAVSRFQGLPIADAKRVWWGMTLPERTETLKKFNGER